MNRVHKILHTLMKKPLNGQRFHYLCVAIYYLHDLRLQGLGMLTSLKITFFWTRSSLRFQDLTALLYRFEVCPIIIYILINLFKNYLEITTSGKVRSYRPRKHKNFHLSVDYRSHAGIVNCTHAVIELISKYFPYTINTLPRERGMTNGPMPIFYQDVYPEFLQQVRDIRCEQNLPSLTNTTRSLPLFYFVQVSNGPSC